LRSPRAGSPRARPPSRPRSALWATAVAAGGVAAAVRVSGALHYAFWRDEVASARIIVQRTPIGVLRHVARRETTPPLWYLLGWLVHAAGASTAQVRFVSVVAGGLLAGAVVVYARRLLPLWAAALAGLGVALGYEFVFHGRELRAYELHALLTVLLPLSVERLVEHPSRGRVAVLALVVAAGGLTNYFFLLSAGCALLWILTSMRARPARRQGIAAIAAGLVPPLAWAPVMAVQYRRDLFNFIGPFDWHDVATTFWFLFARAQPRTALLHEAGPLLVLAGVVAGCALLALRSDAGRLCALLALGPFAAAALVWLAGPRIYDVRNLLGIGPFAAVALAALLTVLPRPAAAPAGALAAAALVLALVVGDRVEPVSFDRVARALVAENWSRHDPIVFLGNFYAYEAPLEWYLPEHPQFAPGSGRDASCAPVYVVAVGASDGRRAVRLPGVASAHWIRAVVVARAGPQAAARVLEWRGSSVETTTAGAC
jgi:hypothetical protein